MIDKLKGFIDIQVPVDTCSLRCHYCYITQKHLFDSKLPKIKYTPEQVGKALARERLGGTYHINMCGNGETLLPPEMTGIVRAILEQGHYIMIVTNGTITRRFEEMAQYPEELRRRLGFKFSFHYLELKKRKLLDAFFANIERVRQAGCSFSLEVTPSDELIPYIDELKEESLKRVGALPHLTVARDETNPDFVLLTEMSREDYIKTWSTFNSPLFDFKIKIFLEKRNEFCYNGLWGGILSLGSGRMRACDNNNIDKDIFADYTSPITLRPVGICNKAHCHNGHSWLTLGMIPSMETPLYASMRDRIDSQGRHWLNDDMRQFLSQKIKDSNTLLSSEEEALIRRRAKMGNLTYNAEAAIKNAIRHVIRR